MDEEIREYLEEEYLDILEEYDMDYREEYTNLDLETWLELNYPLIYADWCMYG